MAKITEKAFMGEEPEFENTTLTPSQLLTAYRWYSYYLDKKVSGLLVDPKEFILEYFKEDKDKHHKLSSLPQYKFSVVGWQARLMNRGYVLPIESQKYFNDKIKLLLDECVALLPEHTSNNKIVYNKALTDLEVQLDKFWDGHDIDDPSIWLKKHPTFDIKKVVERCVVLLNESKDLKLKEDIKFFNGLLKKAQEILNEKKASRKPRKKNK